MADDKTPEAKPATPPAGPKPADTQPVEAKPADVVPKAPKPADRDRGTEAAQEAELKRQDEQREAVAKAGRDDLPKLGGPMKSPGLGR